MGIAWPPLIEGVLVKRYKRFLADVKLPDGSVVTAHCPNSGSMKECAEPGRSINFEEIFRQRSFTRRHRQIFNAADNYHAGVVYRFSLMMGHQGEPYLSISISLPGLRPRTDRI